MIIFGSIYAVQLGGTAAQARPDPALGRLA